MQMACDELLCTIKVKVYNFFYLILFPQCSTIHSKVRSFEDCVCPLLLSILFVHFIFPCLINSLCVHLVSTCRNQKSVDINLLTRLTVHCMLEPLFVRMKPDNIFITCSCRGYGCIVAAIVYIFHQLISQGNKISRDKFSKQNSDYL